MILVACLLSLATPFGQLCFGSVEMRLIGFCRSFILTLRGVYVLGFDLCVFLFDVVVVAGGGDMFV